MKLVIFGTLNLVIRDILIIAAQSRESREAFTGNVPWFLQSRNACSTYFSVGSWPLPQFWYSCIISYFKNITSWLAYCMAIL